MHVLAKQNPATIQESSWKVFNKLCNFSCKFLIPSSGCLIFNSHWKCKHLHLKPNESSSNCHPTENSLKNAYEINCEFIKMGLKWRGNGVRNSCRILLIKWHIRYEWRFPTLCTTLPKQTEGYANNWNHPHTHTRKGTWAGRVLIGFMSLPKQREQLEPGNGYGGSSTPACPLTHHLKYKKGANLAVEWSQPNQQKKKRGNPTRTKTGNGKTRNVIQSLTHLRTLGISPRSTASRNFFSSSSKGWGNPSGTQQPPTVLGALPEAWLPAGGSWAVAAASGKKSVSLWK